MRQFEQNGVYGADVHANAALFAEIVQDDGNVAHHTHHSGRADFDAYFAAVAFEDIYLRNHALISCL